MKFNLFRHVLVLFLILCTSYLFAQIETKVLSPKKMKSDLKKLLYYLEGHPDPYTKISKEDFDALILDVEKNISQELDLIDCYKQLARVTASIKDGHTQLLMPSDWLTDQRKKYGVFPYEVYLTEENELYVIESYGDDKIPLGAQILEINGTPVIDFVNKVDPILSYELESFRNNSISKSFERLLYLIFKEVNNIKLKIKVAEESEVSISTIDYKEWKKYKKDNRDERSKKIEKGKPYDFEIIAPGIARIDIFSFSIPDIKKYIFFLNNTFKEIRKEGVHSLIIDVRENYGGWPKASSKLFHYISEGHFKTMGQTSMKISTPYRRYFTDRNPRLRNANIFARQRRHYLDIQAILKGKLDTYSHEDAFFNEEPITEQYEFYGDTYLLTDRRSYSAASSFAATFQCYTMGYIIGEPTGGTKIFRANAFTEELPKSDFRARISTTLSLSTCYNEENQPVEPNVIVKPTILDLVHGSDPQLNTALMLIRKVQKQKKELKAQKK